MIFETQLEGLDPSLDKFCGSGAEDAFQDLDPVDLNILLFRAEGEEMDATGGEIGAYDIPGYGKLKYCGLEGWMHPLKHIIQHNDLGHAVCGHLREGTWALDYISRRLFKQVTPMPKLRKPAEWFKERFDRIKATVPPYLRPKYFAIMMSEAGPAQRCSFTSRGATSLCYQLGKMLGPGCIHLAAWSVPDNRSFRVS